MRDRERPDKRDCDEFQVNGQSICFLVVVSIVDSNADRSRSTKMSCPGKILNVVDIVVPMLEDGRSRAQVRQRYS